MRGVQNSLSNDLLHTHRYRLERASPDLLSLDLIRKVPYNLHFKYEV